MAIVYQEYVGKITIDSSNQNFTLGADAVTIPAGDYYTRGYSGESDDQLVEEIDAQLKNINANYSATYSTTTGLITFDYNGASKAITWDDADLQTILGFTGTQSSATSHTTTNSPKGIWRPSRSFSNLPTTTSAGSLLGLNSNTRYDIASDGSVYTTEGIFRYHGTYKYDVLSSSEVLDSSGNWSDWNTFYNMLYSVIHRGMPCRVFPDRSQNTSTSFKQVKILPPNAGIGSSGTVGEFRKWVERFVEEWNGVWSVEFSMWLDS